jgi:uncharacterized repeat protein (TIGR01451 family)
MKKAGLCMIGLVAVLVMATTTWAIAQGHIALTSVAEVEQQIFNEEGKKEVKRVPASKVVPGSEVIFTSNYENISQEAAEKAVITNPIPEHMVYVKNSAQGRGAVITFSVDNGKSYNIPAKLFVFDAAGRKYPAQPKDYTHIQWTFQDPLAPGAKGSVSFRAILE